MNSILITGHTSGFGEIIFNKYKDNHKIAGLSRSNGYDITNEIHRKDISIKSLDYDIFINNAYSGYSQVELLKLIFDTWNQNKKNGLIINIGSRASHDYHYRDIPFDYDLNKLSLKEMSKSLSQQSNDINIAHISFGYLDTMSQKNKDVKKLSTNDATNIIDFIIKNPTLQFRDMVVEKK